MKIYTRTGDGGETGLCGGTRVSKAAPQVAAYGDVDELNAALGLARSLLDQAPTSGEGPTALCELLESIQTTLFSLGAELASAPDGKGAGVELVGEALIESLELAIDQLDEELPALRSFVLPGGSASAAALHLARTVCRRAERAAVRLAGSQAVRSEVIRYLNRLSDLLFVMARAANVTAGAAEIPWAGRTRGSQ